MINVSIYQLLNAFQPQPQENGDARSSFDVLLRATASADTAWQIREIADATRAALERYEEIRLSLLAHYGQRGPDDRYTFETDEQQAAFNARYTDLLNHRIDLPVQPLTREQLADIQLSASDLDALYFLVEAPPATEFNPLADFTLPELAPGEVTGND